ncbi:MAG: DUF2442 domain-containing protein [Candidatus Peregrinibacteria bacterium]
MLTLTNAKALPHYRLQVSFNDGREGIADLKDIVEDGKNHFFTDLKDQDNFKKFSVDYTIEWENGADIAPEYLYFQAFQDDHTLQNLFQEWGYKKTASPDILS